MLATRRTRLALGYLAELVQAARAREARARAECEALEEQIREISDDRNSDPDSRSLP